MWLIYAYLEIPLFYLIGITMCYVHHLVYQTANETDWQMLSQQAIVICGIMTCLASAFSFLLVGLQCMIHLSFGLMIGCCGLYYLRPGIMHYRGCAI